MNLNNSSVNIIGTSKEVKLGDTWYIKYPDDKDISTVIIENITPNTVYLRNCYNKTAKRYLKSEIFWIEQVE